MRTLNCTLQFNVTTYTRAQWAIDFAHDPRNLRGHIVLDLTSLAGIKVPLSFMFHPGSDEDERVGIVELSVDKAPDNIAQEDFTSSGDWDGKGKASSKCRCVLTYR